MHLILDSGAFSAWNLGVEVDLDDYARYVKENSESIDAVINLDVIPATPGNMPTREDVEDAAARSWDNLIYLEEEHGIFAVPVFHQGEDSKWLQRMIDHGCPYIGISPANDRSTVAKMFWLDRVFAAICNADGIPCVRTHSFGATSVKIAIAYPWYSVDSTTWLATGSRFGMVMIPKPGKNGLPWSFDDRITRVFVSKESVEIVRPGNFNQLGPTEQDAVRRFVTEHGLTMEDLAESRRARNVINAFFYKELERPGLRQKFVPARHVKLFNDFDLTLNEAIYPDALEPLKVVFATNTTHQANEVLNTVGANDRLLSYFYLKTLPPTWLAEYVVNGLGPAITPRPPKPRLTTQEKLSAQRQRIRL